MMNKRMLLKKYFNQSDKLTLVNSEYRNQVKKRLGNFLSEDLGSRGDITSNSLIQNSIKVNTTIIVKENGVVAGVEEVKWLLIQQGLKVKVLKKDGARVRAGDKVLAISGGIKNILKIERVALNVLQRLSGIATVTAALVKKGGNKILICPTRKTQWGLMDKKAVAAGGGGTHRLNLGDFILIKDNHLKFLNGRIEDRATGWNKKKVFWEIEVDNWQQMIDYAALNPGAMLLDNFTPTLAAKAAKFLNIHYPNIIVEISGGVNADNFARYARSGADVVSLGALTHSTRALDLSLEIE